jgi:hypothetical protein
VSRGSVVRYSDWLRAGRQRGRGSNLGRVKNFNFSTSSRSALRSIQPPIQWVPAVLYTGIKRQRREADHSPPISAEVKKTWIYTSTPPYAFMAQRLICQAQRQLYLYYYYYYSSISKKLNKNTFLKSTIP